MTAGASIRRASATAAASSSSVRTRRLQAPNAADAAAKSTGP